jgi:bilirubin oxidase
MPLVIPPPMPRTGTIGHPKGKGVDYYEIAVRQFAQQILPAGYPATTVWSYGSPNHPGSFNYPAFTIEAKWNRPVRVKWINDLKDPVTGQFRPHILPVDPTLHWANPPGPIDERPAFIGTPGPYLGPVPIVTHVHGAHTGPESDGYPEAWYLPAAANIPIGYSRQGSSYDQYDRSNTTPGTAVFQYPNNQRATTLWYHDHTLGMTRLNVYAGPAGFYLIRGGPDDRPPSLLPNPAPAPGDPPGLRYHEIPIGIQDRSFKPDGSLFYPDTREFFDGFNGPFIPHSDMPPIWNPEFFGNAMVVNGVSWPYLEVEQRRYRFRLLNGCNSRFLLLELSDPRLSFWQIGAEGGFLRKPVELGHLLMAPAERADVIVDFSRVPVGSQVRLLNLGPDEPFGGGEPGVDFPVADPDTTGQVMEFRIMPRTSRDRSLPPHLLPLPPLDRLAGADENDNDDDGSPRFPQVDYVRQVSLNEVDSAALPGVGPQAALLGTVDSGPVGQPLLWDHPVTENPALGATEIWEIYNFTEDAHPIHLHQVQFRVLDRQDSMGAIRPAEAWESGFKDTVIAYPGEITRILATFDIAGLYVWHCHIVEHEDNEMMRPLFVG